MRNSRPVGQRQGLSQWQPARVPTPPTQGREGIPAHRRRPALGGSPGETSAQRGDI